MTEQTSLSDLFNLPQPVVWDAQQLTAISRCCDMNEKIVPVTGRAGSGKTKIIQEVERSLQSAGYMVGVSAPTGKAASRVKEATGIDAMTNHRMLGYGMPFTQTIVDDHSGLQEVVKMSTGPRYSRAEPMPYDVILCDEYAMVNQQIHRDLISCLKRGGRIRMFGDVNQLRPIEEDRRLQDMPSAFQEALSKFQGIELTTNHRQAKGSGIAENASRILTGRPPMRKDDFDILFTQQPVLKLQEVVREALEKGIDYSTPEHQIITCMNPSWVGTVKLNAVLQQLFWKRDLPTLDLPRWREDKNPVRVQIGSKVVYGTNVYDLGNAQSVFNGEVGVVVAIDADEGTLDIEFADRVVTIPPIIVKETNRGYKEVDPRCSIYLAYALTTHKMQGSECGHGIYIMNKSTSFGQSRRNLYTGISRARQHCTLITDSDSLTKSTRVVG